MAMNLKMRIFGGFAATLLLLMLIAAVGYFALGSASDGVVEFARVSNLSLALERITTDTNELRHAADTFATTGSPTGLETLQKERKEVKDGLTQYEGRTGSPARKAMATEALKILAQYDAVIDHLIEARTRIGETENDGLQGQSRQAAHAIEGLVRGSANPRLTIALLMMRRDEKDLLLRSEPELVREFDRRGKELSALLAASKLPAGAQDRAEAALATYLAAFHKLAALHLDLHQTTATTMPALENAFGAEIGELEASQLGAIAAPEHFKGSQQAAQSEIFHIISSARLLDLLLSLAAVALGVCVAWLIAHSILRPLRCLRQQVAETAAGRRPRLEEDAPDEVLPLVREVNLLLSAQERELERARSRAADLAHGLKTPLAALAGDARLLRAAGQAEIAGSLDSIGETMRRHVERELARARVQATGSRRGAEPVALKDVVDALIRTLRKTEKGESLDFVNAAPADFRLPIERIDLTEALGNLLDNAARHARLHVRVACDAGAVLIDDDGPGLDPRDEGIARRRGGRLDSGGGAGLGLAITQDILDAYDWRMDFARSPLGGLQVRLSPA